MKVFAFVASVVACSFTSAAYAATYNLSEDRYYGDWFSAKLSLGKEVYYRAGNVTQPNSSLFIDYYSGSCDTPNLQIMNSGLEPMPNDADLYFNSYTRVDKKKVIKGYANLVAERGGTNAYVVIASGKFHKILESLKDGKTVRFKVKDDDSVFYTFGLNGSAKSMELAASRCKRQSQGPESYFPDTSDSKSSDTDVIM